MNADFLDRVALCWSARLTSTSSRWDSCSAFVCRIEFPALVTKTTGTLYFPFPSTRFLKHCLAAGMGVLPRTRTPSMSKSRPKELWLHCEGLKKNSIQKQISQFQEIMLMENIQNSTEALRSHALFFFLVLSRSRLNFPVISTEHSWFLVISTLFSCDLHKQLISRDLDLSCDHNT